MTYRASALLTLLLALSPPAPIAAAADDGPREVLILHSYEREWAPYALFSEGIRAGLLRAAKRPVFYDVAVDLSSSPTPPDEEFVASHIRSTFAGRRLRLVVTLGAAAAAFAQQRRDDLFPGTPVLFTAVDPARLSMDRLDQRDAVVGSSSDPRGAVRSLLHLFPRTANLYVVLGRSRLEQRWRDQMRGMLAEFAERIRVTFLDDRSFSEMLERSRSLPPDSALLYTLLWIDAAGNPVSEDWALPALGRVANAPIFGLFDTQVGRGVVGGPVISIETMVARATDAAGRMLDGESIPRSTTPIVANRVIFDARELERWNIAERALPAGREIRFRERTLWDRYRWVIVGSTSVVLVQALLISTLVVNLVNRRRTERALIESATRLTAVLETAGDGIVIVDERGVIDSANAGAQLLFHRTSAEMIGTHVNTIMPSAFREPGRSDNPGAALPQMVALRETQARRKDGTLVPVELAVRETALVNRRMFACVVRDITDRKLAQATAREFGGRLLHAQEDERARLARELHDDITQRLARLAMDAGRAEQSRARTGGEPAPDTLRELRDGLLRLSEDVHDLAYQLHPAFLERLGLANALKEECQRFSRQFAVQVHATLDTLAAPLPKETALCFFRVAQEALRNVVRHSGARSVSVSLRPYAGGVRLIVRDDGVGFDARREHERPSLGLASMRERLQLLAGTLAINSTPGEGTTVAAWLPGRETADGATPSGVGRESSVRRGDVEAARRG